MYREEEDCIVLSRGIIAFIFVALILVFTFSAVVLDPMHEADEVPVRIGMSRPSPVEWGPSEVNVVVVRMPNLLRCNLLLTELISGVGDLCGTVHTNQC